MASQPAPRRSFREALAVYTDRRLIAVFFMGFSSGLPLALTSGTLQVWQTRAGVDLTTIGFFVLVGAVYSVKFLWAPFMDRVVLPGPLGRLGRRRGWAILTQIALMASVLLLGFTDPASNPAMTAFCAVLVAFASASQDVVIDAYRIELLEDDQQAAGAAMTQYGYRLGMLASGAGALYLASDLAWSTVYMIMAALVLVGVTTVLLTPEPRAGRSSRAPSATGSGAAALAAIAIAAGLVFLGVKFLLFAPFDVPGWIPNVTAILAAAVTPVAIVLALPMPKTEAGRPVTGLAGSYADMRRWLSGAVVEPFAEFINRSGLKIALLILAFILLYKFGDAIAGVMANPFYVRIGFTNEEIASVSKVFGLIATLVGVFLGGLLVARVGVHTGLLVGGILQMLSNLMFAAQAAIGHDIYFLMLTIGFENLAGGVGSAAFVAYLSSLCNVAFTGTQYALFSSLAAIGRTVLSAPGGLLAESMGWVSYFLLSTVVALPGLLLLLWMMRRFPAAGRPAMHPAAST